MYDYRAQAHRIIGPVTLYVTIDLGFNIQATRLIRLDGVTMPQRDQRAEAIHLVTTWLGQHETFILHSRQAPQQQGLDRYLGVIKGEDGNILNGELMAAGLVTRQESGLYPDEEP